jgi:hypothetical protein
MEIRWKDTDKSMVILWKLYGKTTEILWKRYGYFMQNTMFLVVKFAIKKAVLKLSFSRPNVVLISSYSCPKRKSEKHLYFVLMLPYSHPSVVLKLSAQKHKKRTTPFGGMALSYIHSPRPYISQIPSSFHIHIKPYLQPFKFIRRSIKI